MWVRVKQSSDIYAGSVGRVLGVTTDNGYVGVVLNTNYVVFLKEEDLEFFS